MKAQRRRLLKAGFGSAALAALVRSQTLAAAGTALFRNQQILTGTAMNTTSADNGMHDFDFYFGRWHVHNERLKQRLVGCTDWQRFEAVQTCRPILGGCGNEDEFVTDEFGPTRFIGMSLRLFDPHQRQWSIYWADNQRVRLEPPVLGRFQSGVGTFYGRDRHQGTPVLARFIWSGISANAAKWEQAFSTDDGKTWETNWRMHMTRIA